MEYRSQKALARTGLVVLALTAVSLQATEFRFQVLHDHLLVRKDQPATLVVDEHGITFQEQSRKKKTPDQLHHGHWGYQDVEQLYVSPDKIKIVTYQDRKWALGVDQEYEFKLLPGQDVRPVYELLKNRLDRRFVAAVADEQVEALWTLPVKLLGKLSGSQGTLRFSGDRIVYLSDRKGASRTWRYQDIENISSSDPYQLTITSYERAATHYGSRKGFNFQLKQPLDEKRFNLVWRRLNAVHGLELLTSIPEKGN
ncbi:hypothetical protein [uncultured Paludibaculum sp.]|uniref:hypothetical protein n=1 Tax=uncultured Paludibaculum sp. TaxID=1765020 RepID=UPI002AAC0C83|nr:hypothetical protein [uncultured Paludibaculum sp.]